MRTFRITFALTDDNIRRLKDDVAEDRCLDTTATIAELFAEYLETVLQDHYLADGLAVKREPSGLVVEAEEVFSYTSALPELADSLWDLAAELQHIKLQIDDIIQTQGEETGENSPNQPE